MAKRGLGFFQKKVYERILEQGRVGIVYLYAEFAPWTRRAGERNGHSENYRVQRVIDKLVEKKLIRYVTRFTVEPVEKEDADE